MPACFICSSQVNESTSPLDVERPATKSCLIRASLARCSETKGHSRSLNAFTLLNAASPPGPTPWHAPPPPPCTRPGSWPATPRPSVRLAGPADCCSPGPKCRCGGGEVGGVIGNSARCALNSVFYRGLGICKSSGRKPRHATTSMNPIGARSLEMPVTELFPCFPPLFIFAFPCCGSTLFTF